MRIFKKNIEKKVFEELRKQVDSSLKDTIKLDHRLREDLNLTSINMVIVVNNICDFLKTSILDLDNDELINLQSVENVVELFNK